MLLVAPLVFTSSLSLTMLSQMGIAIIACLAYNMLLGQGGMLSFGHAVYSGPGLVRRDPRAEPGVRRRSWPLPVSLMPLVGGLGGLFFAVLLGYVTTKKAGTTFAMITLGIGELVCGDVADDSRLLRRRGRHHRQPRRRPARSWASPSARRSRCTT